MGKNSCILACCLLFCFCQSKAQVTVQDSLALVALYNKIPALQADTTWLHGNVSTWSHILEVSNRRVRILDLTNVPINDSIPREICNLDSLSLLGLNSCQLIGIVPKCLLEISTLQQLSITANQLTGIEAGADLSKLTHLESLFLTNNRFTDMPDVLSISSPNFQFLEVENNYFNFDDLLPITQNPPSNYLYQVQHTLGSYQQLNANVGDTVVFPDVFSLIGGNANNVYTWKKLGDSMYVPTDSRFQNVHSSALRIAGADLSDNTLYRCEVTNPALPGLTLQTEVMALNVVDPLTTQTITYNGNTTVHCGDSVTVLNASASSGETVSFVSLNDTLASIGTGNTLIVHQMGEVTIRASAPGDSTYHPATLDIPFTIAIQVPAPTFSIAEQLPTHKGDDLHLSVQDISGLTYLWTTPSGQTYHTAAIVVSPLTTAELGTYKVQIMENTCLRSSLSLNVDALVYGKPIIYELITPNGDGNNETFYIDNLNPDLYNEVTVFNAVNQIVFHQKNYQNDWDGNNLPVGTYYYLVTYGTDTYKGSLYIKR